MQAAFRKYKRHVETAIGMQLQAACRSKWPPLLKSSSPLSALTPCCRMLLDADDVHSTVDGLMQPAIRSSMTPWIGMSISGRPFLVFCFCVYKTYKYIWILLPFCLAHHIFCRTSSAIGSVPLFVIFPAYPDLCSTFCTSVHKTGCSGLDWKMNPCSGHWTLYNPEWDWEQIAVSL